MRAVDLFAGAGGATRGLRDAGFDVIGAVELDQPAAETYRLNHPDTRLMECDIRELDAASFRRALGLRKRQLDLLKACPPCQGFSALAKGEVDEARNDLVLDVVRFVKEFMPRAVLLENVPGLSRDSRFEALLGELSALSYTFTRCVLDASQLGVPQRRKRLIVVAIRSTVRKRIPDDIIGLLPATFDRGVMTAGEALEGLRKAAISDDPLNKHRQSSAKVAARIASIPVNGNRFDLPPELRLECHKKVQARSASASYGRVRLGEPAPTMTTRCTTPACGSFIHPTENRGLTLREAATLQTFPADYIFSGDYGSVERQIGNAVPVKMAAALGLIVMSLIRTREHCKA